MRLRPILVLASTFPTGDEDPVPRFVLDQLIALKRLTPQQSWVVLAPFDARQPRPWMSRRDGYDEYRFHYAWPGRLQILAGRGIMPQLRRTPILWALVPSFVLCETLALLFLCIRLNPQMIYAHWFTPQGLAAALVGSCLRIPYAITTHASDVAIWKPFSAFRGLVTWAIEGAFAMTAVSRRSTRHVTDILRPSRKSAVAAKLATIPMGIHRTRPSPEPASRRPPMLLYLGRLAEKKGVGYLLEAFGLLTQTRPDLRLVIAGDGPQRAHLHAVRRRLGISSSSVVFAGYVTGEAKTLLLSQATILVLPSIIDDSGDAEGLPVTLLEGLDAGLCCVATDVSGAEEVLDPGQNGFLCPSRDATALAAALETALDLSPADRDALGERARRTAEQYNWPEVAIRHRDHFQQHFPGADFLWGGT